MPITRNDATAIVLLRGIGLACFNTSEDRCEAAMIRDDKHIFTLIVSRLGILPSGEIGWVPIVQRPNLQMDEVSISVRTEGECPTKGVDYFTNGAFIRTDDANNDEDDFRWVVNLEGDEMHGVPLVKNDDIQDPDKRTFSEVQIYDSIFFGQMPPRDKWPEYPYFLKSEVGGNQVDFGYIAETLGAKIIAEKVKVKLTVGDSRERWEWAHVPSSPILIEISNVDPDLESMDSDLPVLYTYLQDEDGTTYELLPRPDSTGGMVRGKTYCHITRLDQTTIENFVPSV